MHDLKKITSALRGLNHLEAKPLRGWAKVLSPGERALAIDRLREFLPTVLLGHHDRMLERGKASIASVVHGVCGGCHLKLPSGHQCSEGGETFLDVCEYCGVFLERPAVEERENPANPKPRRKGALA